MTIALHWDLVFINPVYLFVVAWFGIISTSDTMRRRINALWRKLTQKAMDQSTGKLETAFFESVYRIVYASGLDLSDQQTVLYRIYSFITKVVIAIFVSSEIWYLYGANSLDTVIENINVTTIHLLVIYRYKSMVEYKHIYHKLAKSMDTPLFDISTPTRKKIYEYWRRMNANYYNTLLTLASCTLSVWYSYPLIDNVDYNLPTALKIPIDYKNPEYYSITYIICTLLFHQISMFVVVNDLMIQAYLIHMICQFAVLSHCFQTVVSDCNEINGEIFRQKFLKRLGELVAQHQFLLNNSTQLSKILNRPMLCQLLASGMLICFAGYQITATISGSVFKFLLYLMYLVYNMYMFYVLCRWCDEIKNQSENIGTSVYHCGWERVIAKLPEAKTRLMLIIARCNRPVVMSAGGIYDVSLMSYSSLVKTSYSTLTVLLRVRQR